MGALLDALGWAGEALDKPGRAVRGALGGQGLGALKNLIPFSDTAGITDPSQSISGRDLLQQWGAVGANSPDDGIGWDDVAGFGTEMLLDPTNLIGLGTLKHLGKLRGTAKAASPAGDIARTVSLGEEAVPFFPGVTPEFPPRTSGPGNIFLSEMDAAGARGASEAGSFMGAAPSIRADQSLSLPTRESLGMTPSGQSVWQDAIDWASRMPYGQKISNFMKSEASPGLNLNPGYRTMRDFLKPQMIIKDVGPADFDAVQPIYKASLRDKNIMPPGMTSFAFKPVPGQAPVAWTGKLVNSPKGLDPLDVSEVYKSTVKDYMSPDQLVAGQSFPSSGLHVYPENISGYDYPGTSLVSRYAQNPGEVLRHEAGGHGASGVATQLGRIDELPLMQRIPATLEAYNPRGSAAHQLGTILNEAYSQAIEGRTPWQQAVKWADFMGFNPIERLGLPASWGKKLGFDPNMPEIRSMYANQYDKVNPLMAQLYHNWGDVPYYAGAGLAGAGVLGGLYSVRPSTRGYGQ